MALDLHRMNKIIEVNEKFSYAVVEPGVTFGDLYTYCATNKLKVWPSTASLGWGSVIGNVGFIFFRIEDPLLTQSRR
jgi:FAD/FMN-containing dehydrogenase